MMQFARKFFLALLIGAIAFPIGVFGQSLPDRYPRLANYYLNPTMTTADAIALSRWDVVVIGMEQQYVNPSIFQVMRQRNPDIIILAYVLSEEMPSQYLSYSDTNYPQKILANRIDESWWLRNVAGQKTGFWPGANMLNVSNQAPLVNGERWNTTLAKFMHETVMSTGLWDGIFYDNVFNDISWLNGGDVDLDRNGVRDTGSTADIAWREGMQTLLTTSRQLEGNDKIILGNGNGQYYPTMNGRLIEEFPSTLDGGWSGAMATYADVLKRGVNPALVIVNRVGTSSDYQSMRFGLTSTLLGGGFFSIDRGSVQHAALWQFDEYQTDLGLPLSAPRRLDGATTSSFAQGVWRRDFQRGVVIVNSNASTATVNLGEGLEELRGTQSAVNGGKIISSLQLAGRDGRILLKRNITPTDTAFINGGVIQEFTADGQATRQSFFTYAAGQPGGASVILRDLDRDGKNEAIVTSRGLLTVTDGMGKVRSRVRPYGSTYTDRMSVTTAQIVVGKNAVIVVAPQTAVSQFVKVYSMDGIFLFQFSPFRRTIPGGFSVGAGDVNPDGRDELMVGAGKGWKPVVRTFDQKGILVSEFLAYGRGFRGGVRIAVGDLNDDGRVEIVTGAGPGGGPHVRIFNRRGATVLPGFFALPTSYRQGIDVAVGDMNRTGVQHIFVSTPTIY